jgi:hypothetical protein
MKAISNISKVSGKTTRVKSGWIMKAIARYLDEVGEATAISARLRVHKSFVGEDKYCDRSRKKIKHWRLADRELIE